MKMVQTSAQREAVAISKSGQRSSGREQTIHRLLPALAVPDLA